MIKSFLVFLSCLIGLCPSDKTDTHHNDAPAAPVIRSNAIVISSDDILKKSGVQVFRADTLSGNFLTARFAQNQSDWRSAGMFMDQVLRRDSDNIDLINKAMVLAIGAGQPEKAINLAHKLIELTAKNDDKDTGVIDAPTANAYNIARILMAVEAAKKGEFDSVDDALAKIKSGGISDFIKPLLTSWNAAARGELDVIDLTTNTVHIHHALLIKAYLNQTEGFAPFLNRAINAEGLSVQDIERIADMYTYLQDKQKALALYQEGLKNWPDNQSFIDKVAALEAVADGAEIPIYTEVINTAQDGMALTFYDIAQLLFREYSDESTRVFSNMALHLNPNLHKTHILLGYVHARQDMADNALAQYGAVSPTDVVNYRKAQALMANLYEDQGDTKSAVNLLLKYQKQSGAVEPLIQIGDIYRRDDKFKFAVKYYDMAANRILKDDDLEALPARYWHLHYVRGMALERLGDWTRAEEDLKAALAFKPDDPLILNYLGYAWADKGENLEQALEMIEQAVSLEPDDGYIVDSLGWVYYKLGRFTEAIEPLENAVALLPYDPTINDHLGDAYWRAGRRIEARFQWRRALHSVDEEHQIEGSTDGVDVQKSILEEKIRTGLMPIGDAP